MKNRLVLVFIIFFVSELSSQITTGNVIYDVDMERFQRDLEQEQSPRPSDGLFGATAEVAKDLKVELFFNNGLSVFRNQKALHSDNEAMVSLVKDLISKGAYYTDLKGKAQILVTEFDGKEYNVKSTFKNPKWVLYKETKKIGEFTCFKAVLQKGIADGNREIIAWYTPDIPIALGPKEYVGMLPGLILELDEPLFRYRCSNITLNKKQNLDWPENVENISEEDYLKMTNLLWKGIQN